MISFCIYIQRKNILLPDHLIRAGCHKLRDRATSGTSEARLKLQGQHFDNIQQSMNEAGLTGCGRHHRLLRVSQDEVRLNGGGSTIY